MTVTFAHAVYGIPIISKITKRILQEILQVWFFGDVLLGLWLNNFIWTVI